MIYRMDNFNDSRKPHMARGDFMWGGYAVVIDPRLSKDREYIGDEVYSYRGHVFWRWLWSMFGREFPTSMERGAPMTTGRIYQSHDKLFMSPESWAELQRLTKKPSLI